jgi:hypothetical protein
MGYLNLKGDNVIKIDLPPEIYKAGTLYVGSVKGNNLYYEVWGHYIAKLVSNFTPANIEGNIQKVIYILEPTFYTKNKHLLVEKMDYVKNNMVKREFVMTKKEFTGDDTSKVMKITGIATDIVGDNLVVTNSSCTYEVGMTIRDYHLFVDAIRESCQEIDDELYQTSMANYKKQIKQGVIDAL